MLMCEGKKHIKTMIEDAQNSWVAPEVTDEIPNGDMPGDKVEINEVHIAKSKLVFKELLQMLPQVLDTNSAQRAVITICGGSGVGKSEIASLISYYFNSMGIGSYTLSGDNYPHRIPMYNDAERLHIFRESGLKKMIAEGVYSEEHFELLHQMQLNSDDANLEQAKEYPWLATYIEGGKAGLRNYLGTTREIAFEELTEIVSDFKKGMDKIWLKRMGRTDADMWYENVDFLDKNILIIEWTHGNSDYYEGVDIPVLLNCTPEETLAHRRARNRDGKTDSPFTMRVLELEQELLNSQAHKAKIIITKSGELISYKQYCELMNRSEK